jgi:hypothetical protein
MKTNHPSSSSLKKVAVSALLAAGFISSSQAINVVLSGTSQPGNQGIIDFVNNNFQNVNLTFGDYSNPATIPAGTDLFILGRALSSAAYANAANSAAFNSLTIPVVAFTSYVTRPDGDRWGWHSGPIAIVNATGAETTVTAAGASLLGGAGPADWWTGDFGFSATGTGTVGQGEILATLGGNILVAHWNAGDQSGMGAVFGSERLLFNLSDLTSGGPAVMPDTVAGQQALASLLDAYSPLVAVVPEPASAALLLGGLSTLFMVRRRK